jgi:hypothetical protein
MGLARLDDAEYARRSRERNNRINAAHRQRLLQAGKAQTNVWLSAALRTRLDDEAVAEGVSLSVVVERLLSAALSLESTDSKPVDSDTDSDQQDALMLEVDRLVNAGEKWRDIARILNDAGWRDKKDRPLVFSRLNEQWRVWKQSL